MTCITQLERKTNIEIPTGSQITLIERYGIFRVIHVHLHANSPDVIVTLRTANYEYTASPRALRDWGYACPQASICYTIYDDAAKKYNIVIEPNEPMTIRDIKITLSNPGPTAIIFEALALYQECKNL